MMQSELYAPLVMKGMKGEGPQKGAGPEAGSKDKPQGSKGSRPEGSEGPRRDGSEEGRGPQGGGKSQGKRPSDDETIGEAEGQWHLS